MNGFIHYEKVSQRFSILEESRDFVSLHMGRPDLPLPLFEKILPENQEQDFVYGMLAFPLLELDHLTEPEKAARKGNEINKTTLGLINGHVLQTECRFNNAVKFMEGWYSHNWWHVTVCYLVGGSLISKAMWYQEWLFDITTIWALIKVGNISRTGEEDIAERWCSFLVAFAGILLSHFICAQLLIIGGKIDASYLFSLCKVDAGEELHQVRAYYTEAVVATCKKAKVLESSYSTGVHSYHFSTLLRGSETSRLEMLVVRACGAETSVPWTALCVFMLELNFHSGSSIYSSQWFARLASHTSRSNSPVTHPSYSFPLSGETEEQDVGQKESSRLLRHCGSKSDGVAGIGGVAGGANVRGLPHAPRDGTKASGGLEDSSSASTRETTASVSFSESSSRTGTLAISVLLIGGCRSAGELSVTEKGEDETGSGARGGRCAGAASKDEDDQQAKL
ncbi:hypothetical protein DY000_02023522 [Brassica cretica]|uniref:Uncharacterized protein n=1 Tax=Brassica cretica TaxID=69181 RepID=A0ABQ7E1H6_BRACR|nr:hypothetical protein DY000_02023522 [Brassica cretica]